MMETLLSFIATAVGELLDWLVGAFLSALNLTLDDMVLTFPFLVDGYKLFRSIGIGLIFCIAVWNLIKFFGGQLSETKDTPIQILLRAFISGGLLWYGGYVLELVVDIAKIPFDTFLDTRAITIDFQGILENFSDFAWFGDTAVTLTVGAGTILLIATLLMLLIGWNVLKLMVEVCERYLMIAVLVYASGVGSAFQGWKDMNTAERSKASRQAAAGILSGGVINNTIQSMREARSAAQAERASGQSGERSPNRSGNDRNADPRYQPPSGSGRSEVPNTAHWSDSVREDARNSGLGTARYTQAQRQANGVGSVVREGDRYVLNETAQKAGLSWDNNGLEARNDRIQSGITDAGTPRTFSAAESDIWNKQYPEEPVAAGDEITAEQAQMWNDTIAEAPNAIEGPSDVAGDFMAANYTAAGLPDQASQDVNEAMVRTALQAPLAAEQALMNHHNNLRGNDALGDALLKSAIGEEAFTGELPKDAHGNIRHGRFSNIEALAREDGRRLIKADYQSPDGKMSHFEIYNDNALTGPEKLLDTRAQFQESMRGNMQTVRTKGSGEQIILRKMPVTISTAVPPQQEPPPSQGPQSPGPSSPPPEKPVEPPERRQAPEVPPADNSAQNPPSAQPVPFPAQAGEERGAADAEGPVLGTASTEGKTSGSAGVFNKNGDNPDDAVSKPSKDVEPPPESSPGGQYKPRNDVTQEDFTLPTDGINLNPDPHSDFDSESDIADSFRYEGPPPYDFEPETEPLPARTHGNVRESDAAKAENAPPQIGSPSFQAEDRPKEKAGAATVSGIPLPASGNTEAPIEPPSNNPLNADSMGDADGRSDVSAAEQTGNQGKRQEPTHGGGYQPKTGVVQEEFSIPAGNNSRGSSLSADSEFVIANNLPYEGPPSPDTPPAMGRAMDKSLAGEQEESTSGESTRLSRPGGSQLQTENAPEVMPAVSNAPSIAPADAEQSGTPIEKSMPQQRPLSADSMKNTDISTAGHEGLPFSNAPLWQPYTESEAPTIPEANWPPASSKGATKPTKTFVDTAQDRMHTGNASPGGTLSDIGAAAIASPAADGDYLEQAVTQKPAPTTAVLSHRESSLMSPGTDGDLPSSQSEAPIPEPPIGNAKAPLVTDSIEGSTVTASAPVPDNSRSEQRNAYANVPTEERRQDYSSARNPFAESPRDTQEDRIIDVNTGRFSGSQLESNATNRMEPASSQHLGYESPASKGSQQPSESGLPTAATAEPLIRRDSVTKDAPAQAPPLSNNSGQVPDYKADDHGQAVSTQPSQRGSVEIKTENGTQFSESSMGQEDPSHIVEQPPRSTRREGTGAPPPKQTQSSSSGDTAHREERTVQTTEVTKKMVVEERRQETSQAPAIIGAEMFTVNAPASNQKMRVRGRAVTQDRFQIPVIRSGNGSEKKQGNPKDQKGKSPKGQK